MTSAENASSSARSSASGFAAATEIRKSGEAARRSDAGGGGMRARCRAFGIPEFRVFAPGCPAKKSAPREEGCPLRLKNVNISLDGNA